MRIQEVFAFTVSCIQKSLVQFRLLPRTTNAIESAEREVRTFDGPEIAGPGEVFTDPVVAKPSGTGLARTPMYGR